MTSVTGSPTTPLSLMEKDVVCTALIIYVKSSIDARLGYYFSGELSGLAQCARA